MTGYNNDNNIYVDNAATTKLSDDVISAMVPYFKDNFGNPSSLHTVGQKAKESLDDARLRIANCLGCSEKEVYFTSGGSEADNQAIISAAYFGKRKGKTHIVSSKFEHHAVLHTLNKLEKEGFEVTLVDVNANGIIKLEDISNAIREDTCLVTIMYANNEIGTIQPIEEIGKLCREKNIIFHTDAVQAIGHVKINVKEQNIDMLSLSAHKFHGPKGIGVLYSKIGVPLLNLIEGGAQERGRRAGTENMPAIMGMAKALEIANENIDKNNTYLAKLQDRLIEGLSSIEYSILNGDRNKRLTSNVNFCFEGIEGESMLLLLDDKGIEASSGSACASGSLDPSHVLISIGRPHEIAHGSVRISLCEDNTMEEMDYIVNSIKDVVTYLRNMSPVWRDLKNGKRKFVLKEKGNGII